MLNLVKYSKILFLERTVYFFPDSALALIIFFLPLIFSGIANHLLILYLFRHQDFLISQMKAFSWTLVIQILDI